MRHIFYALLVLTLSATTAIPVTAAPAHASAPQPAHAVVDTVEVPEVDEVDVSYSGSTINSPRDVLDLLDDGELDDSDSAGMLIAALAVFGIFILPPLLLFILIWIIVAHNSRTRRRRYELMSQAIARGVNVPADLLVERPKSTLRSGITLICVGLGIFVFFVCIDEWMFGLGLGSIPLLVGIGRLLTSRLEK